MPQKENPDACMQARLPCSRFLEMVCIVRRQEIAPRLYKICMATLGPPLLTLPGPYSPLTCSSGSPASGLALQKHPPLPRGQKGLMGPAGNGSGPCEKQGNLGPGHIAAAVRSVEAGARLLHHSAACVQIGSEQEPGR